VAKEQVIHNHFQKVMHKSDDREVDFNWDALHFEEQNLTNLGDPFSEEEVRNAINQMPCDKAPGPDGFTGLFFRKCWHTIKGDIMKVVEHFGDLHVQNFWWLNSANIALLPKKEGAEEVSDYRPISLIHAIAKIIAKMLALRLAPCMNDLVSMSQSAFIKKRSIHDNFLYVKNLATRFNKSKTPALLFKLDIRKAFDSVSWEFILDLLQRRGFPAHFQNWVTALFSTATSRVLLNGIAGCPIAHGRGLRQGDPLSPLLFVLAIDPISQILEEATRLGLLHKLHGRGAILRTSLYADDAVVFVAPIKEDVQNLAAILQCFGKLPAFAQTSLRAPWSLLGAALLTLMMSLRGSRRPMHPSRCDTLGSPFRFGASEEGTSNTLRTNAPGSFQLGMASLSTWSVERHL
jgi:mannosylglycoprotein endo-beta-mannosidase